MRGGTLRSSFNGTPVALCLLRHHPQELHHYSITTALTRLPVAMTTTALASAFRHQGRGPCQTLLLQLPQMAAGRGEIRAKLRSVIHSRPRTLIVRRGRGRATLMQMYRQIKDVAFVSFHTCGLRCLIGVGATSKMEREGGGGNLSQRAKQMGDRRVPSQRR